MLPKILFIIHMPPPIHGAAVVGEYIHNSKLINTSFNCCYVNLSLSKKIADIGKGGMVKLWDFIKQLRLIFKTVKNEKPSLCYVTPNAKGFAFYKDFCVVLLLKIMGQKVIFHFHNKGVSAYQNRFFDRFLYKYFFNKSKVILLADDLYIDIEKYVTRDCVYICPNGIPLDANITRTHKDKYNKFTILFLSNMMAEKGVWDLLETCKSLADRGLDFRCDFVGKWSDINEELFESKVEAYHLEKYVIAHGPKYGDEKKEFMQQADLFVFPTYYHNECFPLVLLEAMAYGILCVTTNEGGIPSIIIDGVTGYIVEKRNPKALADKIAFLVDNFDVCNKIGFNGRDYFVKHFTVGIFEQNICNILNKEINTNI